MPAYGVTDLKRPSTQPRFDLVLEPLVQHLMQIDVTQRRRDHPALRRAPKAILADSPRALNVRADLPEDSAALALVRRGALSGFSIEFHSKEERREAGIRSINTGVIQVDFAVSGFTRPFVNCGARTLLAPFVRRSCAVRAPSCACRGVQLVKFWPFRREPEKRQSIQPFTDAIVAAIQSQATGSEIAQPLATAAVETAAGFYGRALATAIVSGAGLAERVLTPFVLSLVGRDLIRRGESVFAIEIERDRLVLHPAGSWDVRGGPRESEWFYRLDLFGPSGNVTRFVPGDSVLHFRYAVDPARPWTGISPIQWARLTAAGHANLEGMITSEAGSPFGYLLPIPGDEDDENEDGDTAALRNDLFTARGKTLLVLEPSLDEESSGQLRAGADRSVARFGANPPTSVEGLRSETGRDVLAACGLSAALFNAVSAGTARREAYRQAYTIGIKPVVRLIAAELRAKLEAPDLALDMSAVGAADVSGRARSFKGFIEAGMHPEDAARETGITLNHPIREPKRSEPQAPGNDGA